MGARRHWLTFEKLDILFDSDDNEQERHWIEAFEVNPRMPCKVEDLSGRELLAAEAISSKVTTRISTGYRPGFDASMRARAPDGTIYNIEAVLRDGDSRIREVTLLASTGLNVG